VKRLVRKRAGRGDIHEAQCEACGCWLGRDAGEFQRRAARGAGGCRDTVIGGCANCALMCPPCRRRAEDRDEHMGMGAGGFWIGHGTAPEYDPRNVPIMLYGKRAGGGEITVWLAAGGKGPDGTGYLYQCPEVE
jgi:hypothetical protein